MQKEFGQFCPVALASEALTQRWSLLIIRELLAGSSRFNDIRRGVPRISASLLKARLDTLEQAQIVEKRAAEERDVSEYFLTEAGRELKPVITSIGEWGQRWARDIKPQDLDAGWLVWNMHRRLNTALLPAGRCVIQIEFPDAPRTERYFWLVHQDGQVDVCLKSPGFAVDLVITSELRALAEVWRGLRSLRQEIKRGSIHVSGDAALRKALPELLLLSVYAPIRCRR